MKENNIIKKIIEHENNKTQKSFQILIQKEKEAAQLLNSETLFSSDFLVLM